ncbi:MAG TPA: cytochrome c family protein [Planctomycetota bacterium]|nr:cytochrome c family protein [Planctomycetota bacterium]
MRGTFGSLAAVFLLSAPSGAPVSAECDRLREDAAYVGSKSCQKCHFKEYGSWLKTKMALTFKALKPNEAVEGKKKSNLDPAKDYSKDPKCLVCHVTGYGKPGGYPAVVEGKEWTAEEKARATLMEGVGCESCHGPGEKYSPYKKDNKEYKWADLVKLGAIHPDEKNCALCHNKESPSYVEFKFAEKIGKDTHEVMKMKADHTCDHKHLEGK